MSTIRLADDRPCRVLETACRWRACLRPGYHTIHSAVGASGCSSRVDRTLTCVRWADVGCPPPERRRVASLAELHPTDRHPLFAWRIATASSRRYRCQCGCDGVYPAWMIKTWQEGSSGS